VLRATLVRIGMLLASLVGVLRASLVGVLLRASLVGVLQASLLVRVGVLLASQVGVLRATESLVKCAESVHILHKVCTPRIVLSGNKLSLVKMQTICTLNADY
jgi:hypothetical protein